MLPPRIVYVPLEVIFAPSAAKLSPLAAILGALRAKGALINNANKAAFEKATENVDDIWMAKADIGGFVKKVIAAARAK